MAFLKKIVMVCMIGIMGITVCACDNNDGTAEKAGKEIDKAFDAAKDKIHEATK